jgi:glycosyltransferase involved in cell wall biosynthesis
MTFLAEDLTVVIPTRQRWDILACTLEALSRQRTGGFSTLVVVDGDDDPPPLPEWANVLAVPRGGPGAARNAGAQVANGSLVLFLGDDMVPSPDLVTLHLAAHNLHDEDEVAVLGHARWHRDVERGRVQRWMDRSSTQFDYPTVECDDAGFGRFYSCNVSLKKRFFLENGGFDDDFRYYYEDLDCGWRLAQKGMRLVYEPAAITNHLHRYDLSALERRFHGVAAGEHLMASRHAWFEPFFLARVRAAVADGAPRRLWPLVVDHVPTAMRSLRSRAELRTDTWYLNRLAPAFLAGWAAAEELAELRAYLGDSFDPSLLAGHQQAVDAERAAAGDEEAFYRTSRAYLYDLTVFAMSGTKAPYHAEIRSVTNPGARLLDYGCGIGADGLRLASDGYDVAFCDYDNPSTAFLRWRLGRRGLQSPVYLLGSGEVPAGFDLAYSFDVIEHVDDPMAFLGELETRASMVAVNLLEEDPADTDLHKPLPIGAILDHAASAGIVRYRRYHGRSHLVIYRSPGAPHARRQRRTRWRSRLERRFGPHLRGLRPWYPVPASGC